MSTTNDQIFATDNNILVRNNRNPINNRTFDEMVKIEEVKGGYKVTVNYAANDPKPVRTDRPDKAMYSVMDMFGLCSYSKLQRNYHERAFDYNEPFVADVAAEKSDGKWNKLSWKDGDLRANDRFYDKDHFENFTEKHIEINVIVTCVLENRSFVFYVYDRLAESFKRVVIDRLNMTVAEAKKVKNLDWQMAKNAQILRGEAKATPSVVSGETVMIFDETAGCEINLGEVAQFVNVLFTNKSNQSTFISTLNPRDFAQLTRVKNCEDPNSRFTAKLISYVPVQDYSVE